MSQKTRQLRMQRVWRDRDREPSKPIGEIFYKREDRKSSTGVEHIAYKRYFRSYV